MKQLDFNHLTPNQIKALNKIKTRLTDEFEIGELILFGSAVKGQVDEESDIDLLVITKDTFTRSDRHKITDIVFEINLQYSTNFSTTVVDHTSWETGIYSVLPFHEEVEKEGYIYD